MHSFPHNYFVTATGEPEGIVTVSSQGLPELATTPPPEFDGPEGYWSPETLLVAAVSDCFILTFRGIAKANRFEWMDIRVESEGVLERVERTTLFTKVIVRPTLTLPAGADAEKAHKLLEKAEAGCLITNSFKAEIALEAKIVFAEPA